MWPSPDAAILNDGQTRETRETRKQRELAKGYNGNGGGEPLAYVASQWPTPPRQDCAQSGAANYSTDSGRRPGTTLTDAMRDFQLSRPAPAAPHGPPSSSAGRGSRRLWSTPRVATNVTGAGAMEARLGGDEKHNHTSKPGLEQQAMGTLYQRQSKKRLNPNFVEWLMGLPIEWTDCERSAMPYVHNKQARPSASSGAG